MIVKCAYCGPLPLADLEELGKLAWAKHVRECHPTWCPPDWYLAEALRHRSAHIDGQDVPVSDTGTMKP